MAIDSDDDYVQGASDKDGNNHNDNNSSDYNTSDSDGGDSDDPDLNISGVRKIGSSAGAGSGRKKPKRRKQRERWEGAVEFGGKKANRLQQGIEARGGQVGKDGADMDLEVLREAAAGEERIADSVEGMLEARKRKR